MGNKERLVRFDIIQKEGAGEATRWTVELPQSIFEPFINDGCSTRDSIAAIIDELASDSYFYLEDAINEEN